MNKIKVLVSVFIFYSFLFIIVGAAKGNISSDATTIEIADIDIPYKDTLESINETLLSQFKPGEYGLSNRIDILNVYVLNYSVSDAEMASYFVPRAESVGDYITGILSPTGVFRSIAKEWHRKHDTMDMLYPGDEIYLYPRIRVNVPDWIRFNAWLVVGVFDAYSPPNEWDDIYVRKLPNVYSAFETIVKLHLGTMGHYDKYYIIDVIETDVDLTGLSPTEIWEYLFPEKKADIVERYGGVVKGEIYAEQPAGITYHELQLNQRGGVWGTIGEIIKMWQNGAEVFTSEDGIIGVLLKLFVYMPILMVLGWILYTEGKSFVPFTHKE